MELNLSVDAVAINKYMAEKVLESALGEQIKKAITEKFKEFDSYNSPLKDIIAQHVRTIIQEQLTTTYAPQIKEAVQKAIDVDKITALTREFVDHLQFEKRY